MKRTIDAAKIILAMEIKATVSRPFGDRQTGSDVTNVKTSKPSEIENAVAAFSNPNTRGLPILPAIATRAGTVKTAPSATMRAEAEKHACLIRGI